MKKRLSAPGTFLKKRVMPFMMLAFLAIFLSVALKAQVPPSQSRWAFLIPGMMMVPLFFILWKFLLSDLADEVYDLGGSLLVKNRGIEASIPLRNIARVTVSHFSNPVRVTVRLSVPCELGDKIVFEPLLKWGGFGSRGREIADDFERRRTLAG
ncbi:MAG: hypothetical protein JWO89_3551 [Verrucomicrobiaceae bacterium]|nr:hypothetical protein [Verrucomicrobiaceae bacterium]